MQKATGASYKSVPVSCKLHLTKMQARYRAEREAGIKSEPGIKSERGIKRERDEEVHELLATASAKKVKGPIANGELVDLSD